MIVLNVSLKKQKFVLSSSGNRTLITRVTGGYTNRYTNELLRTADKVVTKWTNRNARQL